MRSFGLCALLCCLIPQASYANSAISYHGRIIRSDNTPLSGTNVEFKIQIRSPGPENCLLFQETQRKNMSNSGGHFAITINDGSGVLNYIGAATFPDIFSNRKVFNLTNPTCGYAPSADDSRRMIVYFKDETMLDWESMGTQVISPVPLAMQARQVEGFPVTSLMRFEQNGSVISTNPFTQNQYEELVRILTGSTTLYSRRNQIGGANIPATNTLVIGQALRWNGSNWEAYTPSVANPGTVTSVTAGTGLSTFPSAGITSSGAISIADGGVDTLQLADSSVTSAKIAEGTIMTNDLADLSVTGTKLENIVTAGSYASVVVDSKGRVTSGSSGIVTSGDIITSGNLSGASISTRLVRVWDSDSSNYVDVKTPDAGVLTSNYSFVLPPYNLNWPVSSGSSGQMLSTDGAGNLSWQSVTDGTVTSVTAGTGLVTSPAGGISSTGSISIASGGVGTTQLANDAVTSAKILDGTVATGDLADLSVTGAKLENMATVTAGTYGSVSQVPVISVDTKGRVTSVTNATINVLPSGVNGEFLKSDGTNWASSAITLTDLKSTNGGSLFGSPSCAANETLSWSSLTDQFTCISIGNLDASNITAGTLDPARLPLITPDKGGTGLTALGTANQLLGVDASGTAAEYKSLTAGSGVTITQSPGGIQVSATGTGGTVTDVTGTAPITVTNNTTTPAISISQANGSTNGFLSSSDWTTFNNKLGAVAGSSLTSTQFWVGNASNQATAVAMSGDATLASSGAVTLSSVGTSGTYGSASSVPVLTTDAKGRVTSVTNTPIQIATSQITGYAGSKWTSTSSNIYYSTGNVGIGTIAPNFANLVVGSAQTSASITSGIAVGRPNDDPTGGAGGNILVFTTDTTSLMDKGGSITFGGNHQSSQNMMKFAAIQGAKENSTLSDWNGYLRFLTAPQGSNPVERMRISSTGNVGIGTTVPATSLDVSSKTDSIAIPRGTTAQRPASPVNGFIRYNTEMKGVEAYVNGAWQQVASGTSPSAGQNGQSLRWNNSTGQFEWFTAAAGGSGMQSLNGSTSGTQTFATGTAGSDFGINTSGSVHTFNLPSASASNRGLLTSADWTKF